MDANRATAFHDWIAPLVDGGAGRYSSSCRSEGTFEVCGVTSIDSSDGHRDRSCQRISRIVSACCCHRQSTSFFHLDYSRINEQTFGHPFVLRSCLRGLVMMLCPKVRVRFFVPLLNLIDRRCYQREMGGGLVVCNCLMDQTKASFSDEHFDREGNEYDRGVFLCSE